jgi:predicted P-loop ATPase
MADVHDFSEAMKAKAAAEKAALDARTLYRAGNGALVPCEHNAFVLVDNAAQYAGLHFDEFLARQRLDARDWSDADDLECLRWLQRTYLARFSLAQARAGARSVAYARRRDSLQEFIETLPAWDGTERIAAAFSDAWGAPESELMQASARNFFIALIARALVPGAQVDTVWCFEGAQGTFKSRSLRALGGDFHAEISAPIGTADFMREMRGLWIAELSELDSLHGREASTVKRLLSAPADRFVEKYQTHAETYRRRAVAVATTNEASYWEDQTGARRLVPIACGEIRVDMITENRLQWFAEARVRYAEGASWWEFPGTIANAQEERHQVDPWEDILANAIEHGRKIEFGPDMEWPSGWISSAEIMGDWLKLAASQQGRGSSTRLGKVMRRLGFIPRPNSTKTARGWVLGVRKDEVSAEVSVGVLL